MTDLNKLIEEMKDMIDESKKFKPYGIDEQLTIYKCICLLTALSEQVIFLERDAAIQDGDMVILRDGKFEQIKLTLTGFKFYVSAPFAFQDISTGGKIIQRQGKQVVFVDKEKDNG